MIINLTSMNESISTNHLHGDIFQLHMEHLNKAKMTCTVNREELAKYVKGLRDLLGEDV